MIGVADACPHCGRESDVIKALNSAVDSVARSYGWESGEQAARSMVVVGPILARQVKRAALGLAALGTIIIFAFSTYREPIGFSIFVADAAILLAIQYAAWWWLLGGRNTGNPFATVKPVQLWLRRAGSAVMWVGIAALAFEIVFFAATGQRLTIYGPQ